jgi:hypothetical protein
MKQSWKFLIFLHNEDFKKFIQEILHWNISEKYQIATNHI